MDGSLLTVETQHVMEQALRYRPLARMHAEVVRRLQGKAQYKKYLMAATRLSAAGLPRRWDLVEWLEDEVRDGRLLILASGSPRSLVDEVAGGHPGVFADVVGSEGRVNLTGATKAAVLGALYGDHGFDYVGNSPADLAVWQIARRAIVCDASPDLIRRVTEVSAVEKVFP